MKKMLLSLLFVFSSLLADEAHDIMKKIDNNMRGQNVYMQMKMSITSMGHTRTMRMQTWAKGTKKSFVCPEDRAYHQNTAVDDAAELDGE